MSRNSSGIPEPIDFRFWAVLLFVIVGLPAIFGFLIWMRWFAPCSWWAGSPITEVPTRCVAELK